jgi:antitoxin component YwqK of YwqJK toxin-antitoxin module
MNGFCTAAVLGLLVLCWGPSLFASPDGSHCVGVNQTRSAVRDLVKALSDPNNDVGAKAAATLRPILAADPSLAPNWHDKTFWCRRIKKCKPDMVLDEALAVLRPELSVAERKKTCIGGARSGGGGTSWYKLDDYWEATFQVNNSEKQTLGERPKLEANVRDVPIKPPDHFTGVWVTWHVNGQKAEEIQYRDGKYDGTSTTFYGNGRKLMEQHYKEGICEGPEIGWYKSGKKEYEGQYKNEKQDGLWRYWYENGQFRSESNYENGLQNGRSTDWFENGQKDFEEHYRNDKKNGPDTAWDEHGNLLWKRIYRNGELIKSE